VNYILLHTRTLVNYILLHQWGTLTSEKHILMLKWAKTEGVRREGGGDRQEGGVGLVCRCIPRRRRRRRRRKRRTRRALRLLSIDTKQVNTIILPYVWKKRRRHRVSQCVVEQVQQEQEEEEEEGKSDE